MSQYLTAGEISFKDDKPLSIQVLESCLSTSKALAEIKAQEEAAKRP